MKILLLEDDEFICKEIQNYFELNDHQVDYFHDGEALLDNALLQNYDIFLLDINTPKKNGFETLREIRKENIMTPAIYITAQSDIEHVKKGYDLGCSDYVRKPFLLEELELRINQTLHKDAAKNSMKISENYRFDLSTMRLFYKDEAVDLSVHEKKLLYILSKNINQIITTDILKDYVWDNKEVQDNTLRTQIKKLRAKLQENFILNVRNAGYKISSYE
ncbi:response regulator transcription factor [Sulfurimonas sp.]|uniref:response regulator transcription factor n=1 Tax=Sulfurimonas sp. TaxID=2022749 RepID=UPI0019DFADBD|nr:response regulator transcription factor [Sulfurimonas sp.]MBE0514766.1 response regulator transcription factor [Sulfurimonas sp.]